MLGKSPIAEEKVHMMIKQESSFLRMAVEGLFLDLKLKQSSTKAQKCLAFGVDIKASHQFDYDLPN